MIDNIHDDKTNHFRLPLSTCIQLDEQLQKHSLYPYAIDLLSKNEIHQEFLLTSSKGKVNYKVNFNSFLIYLP